MGAQRTSKAFRRGFWLAGIVSAGAVLWNAPQPGARTREQLREGMESVLFTLLDMKDRLSTVDPAEEPPAGDGIVIPEPEPVILEPAVTETEPAGASA
jgi:hypothetical protein